jgi:hypothetical protein
MSDPTTQYNQQQENSNQYTEYLGLKLEDVSKQLKDECKVAEKFMRSKRETWRKPAQESEEGWGYVDVFNSPDHLS